MAMVRFSTCCSAKAGGHSALRFAPVARMLGGLGLAAGLALLPYTPGFAATNDPSEEALQEAPRKANADTEEPDAVEKARRAVDRVFNDPLSGVVVNRTVTVLGKDFYQYFSTLWRQSPDSARFSISIHERPTARFGSEIWVLYRQQRMFHTFLPPMRAATRDVAEVAVEHVLQNITHRETERLTTRNPDLGPEEL